MATAPYPFSFPSAATYPPPPPFPYTFSPCTVPPPGFFPGPAYTPPPAPAYYPFPAAYPPPPPGFVPVPANPTPIHHHPPFPFFYNGPSTFSPAPPESTSPPTTAPPTTGALATALLCCPNQAPGVPLPADLSYSKAETNGSAFQPNAASTAPNRERRPPQPWVASAPSWVLDPRAHKKCDRSSSPASASDLPAPAASHVSSGTKEFQLQRQVAALNHRSLLDINRRLEAQYAQSQSSFASTQGQLSKLRDSFSSLTNSMDAYKLGCSPPGKFYGIDEEDGSAPPRQDYALHTEKSGSATACKDCALLVGTTGNDFLHANVVDRTLEVTSADAAQASSVALPRQAPPLQEAQRQGHPLPGYSLVSTPSMSPSAATAYAAPQVLGEMPQRYGLQSLSRQSIFLSDDSEHSYYARPEKYNLEQAASEPVFDVYAGEKDGSSTDFVDVLASLQEQHTHEDQQTYGSIEYNHSNNEIELPSVTNSELCTELGKAQVHNHEWNMLLTEKREEWDPGIRKTLMDISQVAKLFSFTLVSSPLSMLWDPGASLISIKARQLDQTLQTSIHASTLVDKLHGQENVAPLAGSSVTGFNRYTCLSFWVQYKFYVLWKSEIGMTTCISWDPGIRHYMAPNGIISVHQDNSFIMLRAAHFSECKYPCSLYCKCMLKTEYCPSRCLSEISVSCLKRLRWNPGDFTHMLLVLCVSCREITDNCFADLKLMANTSSKLAALTWHSSLSGTPFLLLSSTTYTWEPGVQCIIDRLLDKFIESNQVQSVQQIRYRAASVWDPGTMLPWYKITVRVNSEHNSFSTAKFNGGKAAYSSKIPTSCLSASFKEEKEMGRMIPEQWRFGFHAMHYCQIFQKCNAMSSQFYWNQDIKFNGIALWMITFNPP